jgi:hypothetical protein
VKTPKEATVVLANLEGADKLGVAFLCSIPLFASVGGAGGGFLGFLSQSRGAAVWDFWPFVISSVFCSGR